MRRSREARVSEFRHKDLLCERTWFMVLLLALRWPVGLALMWEEPKFPRGARIAVSALVPVLSIVLAVGVAYAVTGNASAKAGAQTGPNTGAQTASSTPLPVQPPVVPSSSTVTPSQTTTADTGAPTTSISGVPAGWTRANVTFTLSATDDAAGTGVASTFYTENGSSPTPYARAVTISTQGTTTVGYYSVDKAGNSEAPLTAQVLIDRTAPTLSWNAKTSYTGTATITASAADTLSGINRVVMRLNGKGAWTTENSIETAVPGAHRVEARAYDNAGNWRGVWKIIGVYGKPTLPIRASSLTTGSIAASGSILPRRSTTLTLLLQASRSHGTRWVNVGKPVRVSTGTKGISWSKTFTGLTSKSVYHVVVQSAKYGFFTYAESASPPVTVR